jgi:hypothetical protein
MNSPLHAELAGGRWHQLSLSEQLGHVGSEIGRAIRWSATRPELAERAFHRSLDLLDLTLDDPRHRQARARLREVARAREVVVDYFTGVNQYHSTAVLAAALLRCIREGRGATALSAGSRGQILFVARLSAAKDTPPAADMWRASSRIQGAQLDLGPSVGQRSCPCSGSGEGASRCRSIAGTVRQGQDGPNGALGLRMRVGGGMDGKLRHVCAHGSAVLSFEHDRIEKCHSTPASRRTRWPSRPASFFV